MTLMTTSIPTVLPFALLTIACLAVYKWIVYPLWLSPLSRIPNAHPTSPFSSFWITWNRFKARENRCVYAAHVEKGPVVRLGPSEVSVNCVDGGIRTVYAGGFEKHAFYPNQFSNYGVLNMFSMIESGPHSQRKRLLSNIYAKSSLHNSPTIDALTHVLMFDRLLPEIASHVVKGGPEQNATGEVDVFFLFNRTFMDLVTGYFFGLSQSTNFIQDEGTARWWLDLYQSRRLHTFWHAEMRRLGDFLARIGINVPPKWVNQANQALQEHCMDMCVAADEYLESVTNADAEKGADAVNTPVVYQHLTKMLLSASLRPGKGEESRRSVGRDQVRFQAASEMLDHLAAGHETSAITTTYLFWELARRKELQKALRAELFESLSCPILASSSKLPSNKELDSLPLLQAVIQETLRLHAAIPGSQPRITPTSPTQLGTGECMYKNIPPNVRVSASAYALHRNSDVFPSPLSFDPYRWLHGDASRRDRGAEKAEEEEEEEVEKEERLKEQHRWFWPFSSGGRMCIGSHLAMLQIKLVTATILSNYSVTIADDSGIHQEDAYTAAPRGGQLWLQFERLMTN